MDSPPGGEEVKIINNVVVSHYPSCSVVYNAVSSRINPLEVGMAAKNCG